MLQNNRSRSEDKTMWQNVAIVSKVWISRLASISCFHFQLSRNSFVCFAATLFGNILLRSPAVQDSSSASRSREEELKCTAFMQNFLLNEYDDWPPDQLVDNYTGRPFFVPSPRNCQYLVDHCDCGMSFSRSRLRIGKFWFWEWKTHYFSKNSHLKNNKRKVRDSWKWGESRIGWTNYREEFYT